MKKLLLLAAAAVLVFPHAARAGGEGSDSFEASATIGGVSDFSLQIYDADGNVKDGDFEFGEITEVLSKADDYVGVTVNNNYGIWKVDIYSDNFPDGDAPEAAPFDTRQYGGLINEETDDDGNPLGRLPLSWAVYPDPSWGEEESPGNPMEEQVVECIEGEEHIITATRWTVLKDKADGQLPGEPEGAGTWEKAQKEGYASIAFGNSRNYANLTNPILYEQDEDGNYISEEVNEVLELVSLGDEVTPVDGQIPEFYVFLQAWEDAVAGSYSGTIGMDMYLE